MKVDGNFKHLSKVLAFSVLSLLYMFNSPVSACVSFSRWSTCLFMHTGRVCVYVCACACINIHVDVWSPKLNAGYSPWSLSHLVFRDRVSR